MLERRQAREVRDAGADRIRRQGEVIRAGTGSRRRLAQGRAARRRPALLRPRGRDRGAEGRFAQDRAGRVRRHHRPERLRQEHAAVADLRHPEPTEGGVLVDGAPVAGPSRKVGYMLQQDYLFEWRTILDNVLLGAEIQGADMAPRPRPRDRSS